MNTAELTQLIVNALDDVKAKDVKVFNTEALTDLIGEDLQIFHATAIPTEGAEQAKQLVFNPHVQ